MRTVLVPLLYMVVATVRSRAELHLEILALRQQLAILRHNGAKRPRLRPVDRFFWACPSKLWPGWRNPLIIVKPDTVVGWSRKGFRLFWTWKSRRGRTGRPTVPKDVRDLIWKISLANVTWGAPRVGVRLSWYTNGTHDIHRDYSPARRSLSRRAVLNC